MGRYYNGDIEGKFWFAVQSSDDADFFGSEGYEPSYLEYYFDETHLDSIEKGIKECYEKLGDVEEKLNNYFKENSSYTDKMLAEHLEISVEGLEYYLEWYARLRLGKKIFECVKEQGECSFTAEL